MGMRVTAEGVSSERQRNYLVAKGCHELQGYLLAKPLPIEALTTVIAGSAPQ
jgi:EAL domain-containing protein (putative c-di-GMP-specific phosphodiesterase class I)